MDRSPAPRLTAGGVPPGRPGPLLRRSSISGDRCVSSRDYRGERIPVLPHRSGGLWRGPRGCARDRTCGRFPSFQAGPGRGICRVSSSLQSERCLADGERGGEHQTEQYDQRAGEYESILYISVVHLSVLGVVKFCSGRLFPTGPRRACRPHLLQLACQVQKSISISHLYQTDASRKFVNYEVS